MRILITGITGTLGRKVLEILLAENPHVEIWGIARDEQKLRLIPKARNLHLRLCDIRDKTALDELINEMDYVNRVFHFAALKCVDTLEASPMEAVATNVLGTRNVLSIANKVHCHKVIFTSTDKAVYPVNAYGHSKALAEKLVLGASHGNVVCRYGNILGSRGSFLGALVRTLKEEQIAYLTHQDMTRFWMDIDSVARFVISCGFGTKAGIQIPEGMKSSSIPSLIAAVADVLKIKNYTIKVVGIRPGEKMHEYLQTAEELGGNMPQISSDHFMTDAELRELVGSLLET